MRTAVNLAGVEVEDLTRGEVLAAPGSLFPELVWDVELTLLGSSPKPLKHRKEVHFHHGSRETLARVHLLDRDQLMPGETGYGQVRFTEPMVGVFGEFVLRSFRPCDHRRRPEPLAARPSLQAFLPRTCQARPLAAAEPRRRPDPVGPGGPRADLRRALVMSNLETKPWTGFADLVGSSWPCASTASPGPTCPQPGRGSSCRVKAFLAAFPQEPLSPGSCAASWLDFRKAL
jgi:selenocysteine-specific elongation factor